MRRILCLALYLATSLAAGPAAAQATPEEAEKLKVVLEAWLPSGVPLAPAEANYLVGRLPAALAIGSWRVEPDGDGYQISSPGIRGRLSAGFESLVSPTIFFCATDRIHAQPAQAGSYSLSGDDPLSCRLEWRGEPVLRLVAKSRRTTGSIDPADPARVSEEIILDQVTLEKGTDPIAGQAYAPSRQPTIDRLIMSGSYQATADGRSNLTSRFTLEGFSAPSPGGTGAITADRIVYDAGIEGTDTFAATAAAVALAKRFAGASGDAGRAAGDDPAVRALQDKLLGSLLGPKNRQEIRIEGLVAAAALATIRVGTLAFGLAASEFDRDGVRVTMRLDSKDIAVEPRTAYADWIPFEGTAQLSIEDMPLWTMMADSMLPGERDPAAETRLILGSHMRIGFDAVHFTAPGASLDLKGAVTFDPDAVLGLSSALELRLTGLDGLIRALQSDPQAEQIAAGLTVFQVMGRQTALDDGRAARDYDIVIDPAGKVLVNGADIQALIPKPL